MGVVQVALSVWAMLSIPDRAPMRIWIDGDGPDGARGALDAAASAPGLLAARALVE